MKIFYILKKKVTYKSTLRKTSFFFFSGKRCMCSSTMNDVSELDFWGAAGLRWAQREKKKKKKLSSSVTSHHNWKKYLNCVLLNSNWQPADLDRRKRITVWNELHTTLTSRGTTQNQTKMTRQGNSGEWTQLCRLFCFISLHAPGLDTAIIHRALYVRGHHYQLSAELLSPPVSLQTPSYLKGPGRREPEQGQQPRTASFPPATEADRTQRWLQPAGDFLPSVRLIMESRLVDRCSVSVSVVGLTGYI